jgi:hypothetical protein
LQTLPGQRQVAKHSGAVAFYEGKAMMWDDKVPGCFEAADKLFAVHPLDEERAFAWLVSLRKRKATLADVERQVRAYLASEGCGSGHIREQIERLHSHFGPWLR